MVIKANMHLKGLKKCDCPVVQLQQYSDNSHSGRLIGSGKGQRRRKKKKQKVVEGGGRGRNISAFIASLPDNLTHRGGRRGWVSAAAGLK